MMPPAPLPMPLPVPVLAEAVVESFLTVTSTATTESTAGPIWLAAVVLGLVALVAAFVSVAVALRLDEAGPVQ